MPSVDTWSRLPPTAPRLVANCACSYGHWGWQRLPNSESPPWYSQVGWMTRHPRARSVRHMADLIQATATFPGGCLWSVPDCACSYLHSGGVVAPDPGPETRLPWWTEGTKCRPSNPKQQLPSHAQIRPTLRHTDCLEAGVTHPVILYPAHQITKLLTQDFNQRLHHPGPERVLAEIWRHYCVLHGLEAVTRNQHGCRDCLLLHAKAELRKAFKGMAPDLQDQLAQKMIFFCFNPLWAPHLGGPGNRRQTNLGVIL